MDNDFISIVNKRGQEVGTFNMTNKTYYTQRDASKGQVFLHPKWLGCIALDSDIMVNLDHMKCEYIQMIIKNFEPKPFVVKISYFKFVEKSETICFDKKTKGMGFRTFYSQQRRINLNQFERVKV